MNQNTETTQATSGGRGAPRGADGGAGASQAPVPAVGQPPKPRQLTYADVYGDDIVSQSTDPMKKQGRVYPDEWIGKPRPAVQGFQKKPEPR